MVANTVSEALPADTRVGMTADVSGIEASALSSVEKALALLRSFDGTHGVVGVTELAHRAGIAKSTAHRLLATLIAWGFVRRVGSSYALDAGLFELGNQVQGCLPGGLRDVASPHLATLYAKTGQTIHLGVCQGTDVLYVDKICSPTSRIPTTIGQRIPAACTALGKAMLSRASRETLQQVMTKPLERRTPRTITSPQLLSEELRQVRQTSVAFDREEARLGLMCVGSPIVSRTGALIAGVSICGPVSGAHVDKWQSLVKSAASAISLQLQSRPGAEA